MLSKIKFLIRVFSNLSWEELLIIILSAILGSIVAVMCSSLEIPMAGAITGAIAIVCYKIIKYLFDIKTFEEQMLEETQFKPSEIGPIQEELSAKINSQAKEISRLIEENTLLKQELKDQEDLMKKAIARIKQLEEENRFLKGEE